MMNLTYPVAHVVDAEARDAAARADGKAQSALDAVRGLGALARRDTIHVSHIADPENLPSGSSGLAQDLGLVTQPTTSTIDLGSML